jgi:predicted metal-dependent hydrolase
MAHECCAEPPPLLLLDGIDQFNRGEYFEQHETLEALWRAEPREVRDLYQGILQIGVAFHHIRRGNHHGAVYMLTRGCMYLRRLPPRCQGVEVASLIDAAGRALEAVQALGPARLADFDWALVPRVTVGRP